MQDRILREMQKSNPWWLNKKIEIPTYKRTIFSTLCKYLDTRQIIAIVGLRRVGKTILMKQLIDHQLPNTPKENILFFTFEEQWGTQEKLEDILYYFLENYSEKGQKYIFLDEIQKVSNWEEVLKRFYDRSSDIKFIISGSASLKISKSIESLAGRIFDIYISPLSFPEFLELNKIKLSKKQEKNKNINFKKIYQDNLYQKDHLFSLFLEYIYKGGFPEIAQEKDEEIIQKYIGNSVIERIILRDLPEEYTIKNIPGLKGILAYAARESGQQFSYDNLSSTLGLHKETISNYVEYLRRSFLLYILYNYGPGIIKQLRTSKKIHIVLPSIALALESHNREILHHSEIIGKYVESLIAVFLSYTYKNIWFWKSPQKDEVDIVIKDKQLLPIEVKYQNKVIDADCKSLLKFCKKNHVKKAVMITKETMETRTFNEVTVELIPAWVFLLQNQ